MNPTVASHSDLEAVADLVRARTGLLLPASRQAEVTAGTRKVMAKAGIAAAADFLARLEADPPLLDELTAELTIGETYFFRDMAHFKFVRDHAVPELRRLREPDHTLRVWSAGCASGEEAYSLAMLFDELGLAERVRILATDISKDALARARRASYNAWSLRGAGAQLAGPHLRRSGSRFEVGTRHSQRVEFAYLNLAQDTYPTFATNTWGMDVVLCRNVLIYLDVTTVRAVARRMHDSLAPGGYLITGPSDPLLGEYAPFEMLMTPYGIVYRRPTPPPPRSRAGGRVGFVSSGTT